MKLTGDGMVAARTPRPALAFVACVLFLLVLLFVGKALVLSAIGPQAFDVALSAMQEGSVFDRLAGAIFR